MFGSKDLLFSSETYGVAKSLRFRSGSTTYFNRTQGTPTNNKKWTWSGWVKRGSLANGQFTLFSAGSGNDRDQFQFGDEGGGFNDFQFYIRNSTGALGRYTTAAVYRDPSAWYHVVLVYDSANATAANRVLLYVNGGSVTLTANTTLGIDTNSFTNQSGIVGYIGSQITTAGQYFDGYLAEVNFIDGQVLTPSSFGFYDNNGIWQPQGYTGTYGTNGFYLKFTDVGATSGANTGYGKDFSGFNTNYWTTNNFGTTSTLTTYDSMYDSPVNASNGITGIGNYSVFNPIDYGQMTLSGGNLNATDTSSANIRNTSGTLPITIKTYIEFTLTAVGNLFATSVFGVVDASIVSGQAVWRNGADDFASTSLGWAFTWQNGGSANKKNNNSSSSYGSGLSVNDVIMMAVDPVGGKIWWGQNGTWFNSGDPAVGTNAAYTNLTNAANLLVAYSVYDSGSCSLNAGQRPYAYTPPSGYSALNTQNLTTPTITNGASYMAAVTYTGSASTQSVTATSTNSGNNPNAVTFQPDLVWIKDRTNAQSHKLTDAVRGTTKAISTDSTAAEATDANGVTAFNNNGFSLGTGTRAYSDSNLDSYVAWQWKEGVSQGFDIVSYAGDNTSNRNISHNLGVAPAFVWVKSLSTGSFYIYHQNLTGSTYFLKCNSTDGTNAQTNTNTPWGTGNWSSTQFMVTNNATNNLNASSTNYIGYLWAAIAGYSAFGSYTGNGLADGPFVYTGMRSRYILIKKTSNADNWVIIDTARNTYNVVTNWLYAEASSTETTAATTPDILSNGFKLRSTSGATNAASATFIYAAFAENPFKIARAR